LFRDLVATKKRLAHRSEIVKPRSKVSGVGQAIGWGRKRRGKVWPRLRIEKRRERVAESACLREIDLRKQEGGKGRFGAREKI